MVEAACKQSRRLFLMNLEALSFDELFNHESITDSDLKIVFWEEEHEADLASIDWNAPYAKVCIMLGPEGGFSTDEIAAAKEKGWISMSLGPAILRAETATLAAVSIVQHRLGSI